MTIELSPTEARVIGVLLEKEVTTPEIYPMTINAITTGCNQKSSREPVMSLSERDVQTALDTLQHKRLVMKVSGQRSVKFMQRFCSTEFSTFKLSPEERAIMCLLFLRGPQTPGEIRTRAQRLAQFDSVEAVERALEALSQSERGAMVHILPREPGRRENRYINTLVKNQQAYNQALAPAAHLASCSAANPSMKPEKSEGPTELELQQKIETLEARIKAIEEKLLSLTAEPQKINL